MARHFDGETSGSRRVAIVAGAVLGVAAVVAVAAWFVMKGSAETEHTNDAQVSEVATVADKAAGESAGGVADGTAASTSDASATATEAVTTTSTPATTTTAQTTSSLSPLSIDNDVPADGEEPSDSNAADADTTPSNEPQVNNGTAATGLSAGAPDNDVVVE